MLSSWSIERKLTLIIVAATSAAILAASGLLIGQYARSSRAQLLDDLQTLASVVADNSQASLSFADADDAAEVLSSLRGKAIVQHAVLYLPDGQVLAAYRANGLAARESPPPPVVAGTEWAGAEVRLYHLLQRNGERAGALYLAADLGPWRSSIAHHLVWAALIALFSLVLAMLLASRLQRRILQRINKVVALADAVAAGDLPERLPVSSGDEVGVLQRSFNEIVNTSREVVRQAQALARGDYSITIQPRSSKDELGLALVQMTQELRRYHEQSERQNWLKTALSDLNDRMRGEQSVETLTENILRSLAHQVGALAGAVYLAEPGGRLRRGAGYAVDSRSLPESFAVGEGLVGQVAMSREEMVVDLTADAWTVHTATAGACLRQSALVPLVRENELMGVLELGAAHPFTAEHRELLHLAASPAAIALQVARARGKLNELLQQTQQQSNVLRDQQVALQKSNLELGERNILLEHQKQEIHRQNDALESARVDLEHKARELAQASQYKSEFLANVSHELRTPLNSLLILSRLLAENRDSNLSAKQVEFAQTIHKSGSDLLTLINDILDLSKVEAGRMEFALENAATREVCASVESIFRPLAEQKGLRFEVRLAADAPAQIRTDPHRVGQILRNLMSNAFKFTAQGSVTLQVSAANQPGLAVAFAVQDTGIGIARDKQEMVFAAFQQADGKTSREYGGTGLGLTISRELARRLGGDLVVSSEPGRGSTFTLLLPADAATPVYATHAVAVAEAPVESGRPLRPMDDRERVKPGDPAVLVIEDDPVFAAVVHDHLASRSLACLLAASGEEGLTLAQQYRPLGIVMDMMLPGLDGATVLRRLKADERTAAIPVYVVSAMDRDQQVLRDGAVGVLSKPVSVEQLTQVVNRLQAVAAPRTRRVLVVEDNEAEALSLRQLLQRPGVDVVVAATGAHALHQLSAETVDVVVLDLGLADYPDEAMVQALARAQQNRYLPVIVHTGRELSREAESRLRRDAMAIVIKGPHSPEQLLERVRLFLHLPRPDPVRAAPAATRAPGPRGTLKGRRLLVVDDDMRNAYSLAAVLDREGVTCDLAADGDRALAKLQGGTAYAGVLMDIMMPGRDGYETMRAIRAQAAFKDLPMIALTARAMTGDREKCLEAGANAYLPKPVDIERLLDVLEQVLGVAA